MSTMTEERPTTTTPAAPAAQVPAPVTKTEEKPKEQPEMSIRVVDALGMEINVQVKSVANAYDVRRFMGTKGFMNPGAVPAGGYPLPYDLAGTFDWSLIGAEAPTEYDGDRGVWHNGSFYKLREYEEEAKGKKMRAKIKYSRGARPTDPTEIVEKGQGDINYVTLISFAGRARINPNFVKKS